VNAWLERMTTTWQLEMVREIKLLAAEVDAVDLREFESLEPTAELSRLLATLDELTARAISVVQLVLARFPSPSAAPPPSNDDDFQSESEVTAVRPVDVSGLAFIAHLDLKQARERLLAMGGAPELEAVLSQCERTLRRIFRALVALDHALAGVLWPAPILDCSQQLSRSLRVRAGYARFCRGVLNQPEPNADTITKTLRLIGTSLAVLLGKDIYSEMRVSDRLQLRGIQFRILSWLRLPAGPRVARSGLELWKDIVAFLSMLPGISQRQELVEHDAKVIAQARAAAASGNQEWPPDVLEALRTLVGRSAAIDALLASPQAPRVEPWLPLLGSSR
jgi:hypothetical protein